MSDTHLPALLGDRPAEDSWRLLHRAVDLGLDFTSGALRDGLVLRHATVSELIDRFAGPLPQDGGSDGQLLEDLAEIARWSISQADPRYLAFPDTGDSIAALAADIVASFLNQNLIAFDRSAPAASVIEAQLITWLREIVGYPVTPLADYRGLASLGGMWTSGGNMSNHIAIAAALAHTYPEIRTTGLRALPEQPLILLAGGVEHFSYLAAAQALGLGSDGLLWADATADFTSDPDSVARLLASPPPGKRIFMVVGVAGNCRTTGIDDLQALAELSGQHNVWFHVDACHGGSLLFSEKLKVQLAGIEHADSVALDPHKGLFVSYPSSYVLFRDPAALGRFARYPDRADAPDCLDLGLITPFYGSRGFESLKLWALMKHQGTSGIGRLVEDRQATFQAMVDLLERTGCFRMLGTSDFYRCAFVFFPTPVAEVLDQATLPAARHAAVRDLISCYTAAFADRLYRAGTVVFDLFALQDLADRIGLGIGAKYQVMGMCVGHPHIPDHVEHGIEQDITEAARDLTGRMLDDLQALLASADPAAGTSGPDVTGPAGW
ncbi:pyridoxal-dependent decarboxylase [Streptomyces sp. SP17BM10]|uniref:pyridoxal phosphate-dependent decarboxylase family protein n=1 Tax=Streptomyces sp. SP17BM10 TaxID=3002530 RepID=UPI002E77A81F|nr:pyridoxal-dependent decarboxylase [Streptomyces sp. SP17BM10]MEE1781689.1 pyridoxal-dependent decarboxylase [Streptomyces sp. SP17BM10]